MNLRRPLQLGVLIALTVTGSMALAQQQGQQMPMMGQGMMGQGQGGMMGQQGQQPAPTQDQQAGQQAPGPSGGMMGQSGGMMGPSGGMMGQGMMGQGQGGMMGQRQGGMMDRDGKPDQCPMGGMGMGMKHGMMHSVPMMEARLAYIKADLEITDAQSAVWDAYASAVRARHSAMESVHAGMMKAKENGTVVDRMDARIKALETMADSLKALKPATEALYAALSDEQKKKADQLLGAGCGMR